LKIENGPILLFNSILVKKTKKQKEEPLMDKIIVKGKKGKQEFEIAELERGEGLLQMIQQLIPIGLMAVNDVLQSEVERLAGKKYSHAAYKEYSRWGSNAGSICLGDSKVRIKVPRVMNKGTKRSVPLRSYELFQDPQIIDEQNFKKLINGISCRKYKEASMIVPEVFGISHSSVSKRFIRVSSKKLEEFHNRRFDDLNIVALFIDGKSFSGTDMIIALGIDINGIKHILGFVESGTENESVCSDFLRSLKERGLKLDDEILYIIDGSKGLNSSIKKVAGRNAVIQRCQWHKRENVVSYLSKTEQPKVREKLQRAYSLSSYTEAKSALDKVGKELKLMNRSAYNSLQEGLEETLTLHRLGLADKLGASFKTTNCIENVNSQISIYVSRVRRWHNSDHRQRWLATALLETEPRLRKVKGRAHLVELKARIKELKEGNETGQQCIKEAA